MLDRSNLSRVFLLVSAVLFLVTAFMVMAVVIPPVRADTFPGSRPESAVPAFWVASLLSILLAVLLGVIAARARVRGRALTIGFIGMTLVLFFISFAMQDAANAYAAEDELMQVVANLLSALSRIDFLGLLLFILAAILFPKKV